MTGFDGPTTIASAAAIASSDLGGRARLVDRRAGSMSSIGALAARADHELLEVRQRRRARTHVRTGSSHIGSTRRARPERGAELGERVGQRAPSPGAAGAVDPDREVAVAEVEPDVDAEVAQAVHDREAVVAQAPAALVDEIGEPERATRSGSGLT